MWEVSDVLATLQLTFVASVRMTGPSSWTMGSLCYACMISMMSLRNECIRRGIWASISVCAVVISVCVLFGMVLKSLSYHHSSMASFTLVAQRCGLCTCAVGCNPFHFLLFQPIIHPYSWRTGMARPGTGILRLQNAAFYPLCVWSLYQVMVPVVTKVLISVYFIRPLAFLSHYLCVCRLVFTTTASSISSAGLHWIM